jgi:hypothetical protein
MNEEKIEEGRIRRKRRKHEKRRSRMEKRKI